MYIIYKHHKINKVIFIAIALEIKWYFHLSAKLSWVIPRGSLPSLALKDYRLRDRTSLLEYRIMINILNETLSELEGLKIKND